ncbi:hypothetical protein [Marinifilum sp.]|uniref:hypothetical protein n=1 Tax=Marinifilum sp. TaxID=2033137 RepID=UPI003BAB2E9A
MLENTYNELGELINKKLHNSKQEIDYAYNIRGWLTGINKGKTLAPNRLFGMELYYNNTLNGAANIAQYNGNISAMKWNHQDEGSSVGHAYKFEYDNLNRLAKADYGTYNTSYATSSKFDVYGNASGKIGYDLNGNIESLKRNGGSGTLIDNLIYNSTNQLSNVRDYSNQSNGFGERSTSTSATEYSYDDNGNMEVDLNKNLNIAYNSINLPKQITNRAKSSDDAEYVYSAWISIAKVL